MGFPNGIYLTAISDDSGQKSLLSDTIKFSKKIEERLSEIGSFEETHKNTALLRSLSALGKDADALIGSIARGFQAGRITPQLAHRMSPRQQRLLSRRLNNATHSDARSQSAMQSLHNAQQQLPNVTLQRIGTAAHGS